MAKALDHARGRLRAALAALPTRGVRALLWLCLLARPPALLAAVLALTLPAAVAASLAAAVLAWGVLEVALRGLERAVAGRRRGAALAALFWYGLLMLSAAGVLAPLTPGLPLAGLNAITGLAVLASAPYFVLWQLLRTRAHAWLLAYEQIAGSAHQCQALAELLLTAPTRDPLPRLSERRLRRLHQGRRLSERERIALLIDARRTDVPPPSPGAPLSEPALRWYQSFQNA